MRLIKFRAWNGSQMEWRDDTDDLESVGAGWSGRTINPSSNWAVIGNIYENPELIKEPSNAQE